MHVRLSTSLHTPVFERDGDEVLGFLSGLLLQPDTGAIEGIYVEAPRFLARDQYFCPAMDIIHWGASIEVRGADSLAPPGEHIRLQTLFEDGRTILGQLIRTEGGRPLGHCKDLQFDTERMQVEWLFPKRLWRWGVALPLSDVVEVRREAVIVRDPAISAPIAREEPAIPLDVLGEMAESRVPQTGRVTE